MVSYIGYSTKQVSVAGKTSLEIVLGEDSELLDDVVVVSNTAEPGYDGATIRIRGVNTFGDSSPLIVVDGVPGRSLDRIDPSTIESMSVLHRCLCCHLWSTGCQWRYPYHHKER